MEAVKKLELRETIKSKLSRAMIDYLNVCSRCGICIDKCHVYASHPDYKNSPVYRAELVRRLYKKYFKAEGKIAPSIGESIEFSDGLIDEIYEAAYSCTGCRRCMVYCPFGIDTQLIMGIAKAILITAGREPKSLTMLADMSIQKGKMYEKTKGNFAQAMKNIEQEVVRKWQSESGSGIIPLEVRDPDVLYVALAGKHSIVPAAAIMNAAGEKWSLSFFEAVNFGAFVGNAVKTKEITQRIISEAGRLNAKEVVICECGTAYRVIKHQSGDLPFRVTSFVELIARYIKDKRIKVKKTDAAKRFTYHDPCQLARNSGVYDEPRYILAHLTDNFIELTPTKKENWCCGGGGGLVAVRDKEYRAKTARIKADQIRMVKPDILATACENCHTALTDINDFYKLGANVQFLSALVADSLVGSD